MFSIAFGQRGVVSSPLKDLLESEASEESLGVVTNSLGVLPDPLRAFLFVGLEPCPPPGVAAVSWSSTAAANEDCCAASTLWKNVKIAVRARKRESFMVVIVITFFCAMKLSRDIIL